VRASVDFEKREEKAVTFQKVTTCIALGVILISASAAIAAEKKKEKPTGEACRAACEKDLRAKGLWEKLPYGTCRKRCGMPL
jgi:hypothetical protein